MNLVALLAEYDRALDHTRALTGDLREDELAWRPRPEFSPIGWHLGHQAAVAHFLLRNLTSAEPSPDPAIETVMDSATREIDRQSLPDPDRLWRFRDAVAVRVRHVVGRIVAGDVGAPSQLRLIARPLLTSIVNHEYQHDAWIAEVRREELGRALPPLPASPHVRIVDGYAVLVDE